MSLGYLISVSITQPRQVRIEASTPHSFHGAHRHQCMQHKHAGCLTGRRGNGGSRSRFQPIEPGELKRSRCPVLMFRAHCRQIPLRPARAPTTCQCPHTTGFGAMVKTADTHCDRHCDRHWDAIFEASGTSAPSVTIRTFAHPASQSTMQHIPV